MPPASPPAPAAATAATRRLGRFALGRLVARSSRTMWWQAQDSTSGVEHWLALPRAQPTDAKALADWARDGRHLARLDHPQLVAGVQAGTEAGWPCIAAPVVAGETLEGWLASNPAPPPEQAARWLCDLLQGLAYVHEAGLAHGDIAASSVLIDAQGRALLMPGGVGLVAPAGHGAKTDVATADALKQQRDASARDLLACGLLLHRLLAGANALDEADAPTAVERADREIVRLGWTTPQPVPEPLRAIANRATERDPQRRYLGARSLQRALQGWLDAQDGGGGTLALVLDRLQTVGHLPALPGLAGRVAELAAVEQQRLAELAEVVLQDPALAFEMLRQVRVAQYAANSDGGVTTVRRAIALVGVQGLRQTATGLRAWPGALEAAAPRSTTTAFARAMREALRSAHAARRLCPADMDGECVYLIALLQHLGPLLAGYHLPEESAQLRLLTDPEPPTKPMSEAAAAFAVMGVDLESIGIAVARHWGLDESLLGAMRRVSTAAPVRAPDDRNDMRRVLASAAVEGVAALSSLEARNGHAAAALAKVQLRYARALTLAPNELADAVHAAVQAVGDPAEAAEPVLAA
ncbi:MAG TPA: HDOD domain-containing protein [Methylibium sp.]|uniref:serine/threonine protein kinase n=1 Tax=Methylibium sp. TaxID=2067992 RepID=UPI002DC03D96|nr:HDOD domain-containing protein [Methylibium sp.]HEU4457798.1 HDOD domain-containing protein [Methylibium sp.]